MKHALSPDGLARIGAFVMGKTLLAFDIDGTLAPIVDRPWDARVPHEVQQGLSALSQRAAVAIITGRAIEDARPMLGFAPRYLVGNHGAEGVPGFEEASAHCARVCRAWLDELSSTAEEMNSQASTLHEAISFFTVAESQETPAAPRRSSAAPKMPAHSILAGATMARLSASRDSLQPPLPVGDSADYKRF